MDKQSATRERILQQGVALMSQEGLAGVTLGQLAERVGMSKSGVFAHFRSKEEVQIGLLEYTARLAAQTVVEPSMQEPEGLPRLQTVVRNWFGWAERAGLPGGCPIAAGQFEVDDIEGPVRDKLIELEGAWEDMLAQMVRQCVRLEHLSADLDVDQFVWELCGIYLNHHVTVRFLCRTDADARAETAFHALVERSQSPR